MDHNKELASLLGPEEVKGGAWEQTNSPNMKKEEHLKQS